MRKSLSLLAVCLAGAISIFAQRPVPTPPADNDILKISTNLIQVDVTVTDKKGNIVRNLRPEDFEIFENGAKQPITNFSFISIDPPVKPADELPAAGGKNALPLPPVKLKAEQVRRTYALVVDDLGLSFPSVFFVREALKKFVGEQMRDGDLVAIIRTGSGVGALQSFTSDKRQLMAAIEKLKWNPQGRGGIGYYNPIGTTLKQDLAGIKRADGSTRSPQGDTEDKEFAAEIEQFRNENFSVGSLGSLNYVIRGMGELPGRKAVMFFSEGFVLRSDQGSNRVLEAMRVLADLANRSSVVFYTLDPRGLQVPGMANSDEEIRDVLSGDFNNDERAGRERDFFDTQMSLRFLAHQTGGFPFVNQNNINKGLQRAIDDQSGYYLLGYQPDEATFDPKKNRFNRLEVKLTRPDLRIRYRSGFFGVTDEKMQSAEQNSRQNLMSALTSPFGASGVNLSLYSIYGNDAKNGDIINALVYIDARDLKFAAEANGKRKANFDILAMTFGDNGVPINQVSKNYSIEVSEKVYLNMLKKGFVYSLPMPIKKVGAYQFRVAVRDTASNKVGSASQFIEVPNLKRKNLTLSSLIFKNYTPAEMSKTQSENSTGNAETSIFLDTALRRYKRGTVLRYDYVIYNARTQNGQLPQANSRIRLIQDGKIIFEDQPKPLQLTEQNDLQRIQTAGALTLGEDLVPGNYILQVIVVDELASEKRQTATQFAEFEVIE